MSAYEDDAPVNRLLNELHGKLISAREEYDRRSKGLVVQEPGERPLWAEYVRRAGEALDEYKTAAMSRRSR